jgi:hypothetical protein
LPEPPDADGWQAYCCVPEQDDSTMLRALRILSAAASIAGAFACGSTSSNTVAGPSPAKCQLSATNNTPNFTSTGGQGAIVVQAARECAWTAAAQVNWVALVAPAAGQGDATLKYSVQANPSGLPRRGTVNVAGQTVEVGQEGSPCRFQLDRVRAQIASDVTSLDINVQGPTGCGWTAASEADWIAVTQGAQGSGPGRVTIRALANPGAARVGSVLIAGIRFELTQGMVGGPPPPPPGCAYALVPASAQLDSTAAGGTVSLSTSGGCAWTGTSDQPWLSIVSAPSGTGSAQISYSVTSNSTSATRSGHITVETAVFTVQQAAAGAPPPPPCTFTVSPDAAITAGPSGQTGSVTVNTAGSCAWTASTTAGWIQLTPSTGTGPGQVSYDIAPNLTGSDRTDTITIAGTTISATQSASPPQPITLTGDVSNLSGACPVLTFTLGGRTVQTAASTIYTGGNCPKLKNGDTVTVRGLLNSGGTVDATELEYAK